MPQSRVIVELHFDSYLSVHAAHISETGVKYLKKKALTLKARI